MTCNSFRPFLTVPWYIPAGTLAGVWTMAAGRDALHFVLQESRLLEYEPLLLEEGMLCTRSLKTRDGTLVRLSICHSDKLRLRMLRTSESNYRTGCNTWTDFVFGCAPSAI